MGGSVYHVTDERVFPLSMLWLVVCHECREQLILLLVLVVLTYHAYGGCVTLIFVSGVLIL